MKNRSKKILKMLFVFSLSLIFLAGCGPSEASEVLEDQIFNKHIGDGADGLAFIDGDLLVREEGTITPEIDDPQEHEEGETIHYEDVDLVDGDTGDFIVEYDDEELYRFHVNDDGLLEEEDGTTYITDDTTEESEDSDVDE